MTSINAGIFKAYDVRGIYPRSSTRRSPAWLGAPSSPTSRPGASACRATCGCPRRRWPAAFIDGAREQGADVVDYGMLGTDMMYFAVCRDGLDGGGADHRLAQPEAVQRHEDGAGARRSR